MKTTEQLINEGVEYFNKCGKHLFRIDTKETMHNYKYVGLMTVNGVDYKVRILFSLEDENVQVRATKLSHYPVPKAEFSQIYFPDNEKVKAVRQNKYLKKIIDEIKAETLTGITDDDRGNYFTFKRKLEVVEKSGI